MKKNLTISEMAKLRGVTTETLRHYDRIDLFKPYYVDEKTGYRYYSILQYEVLGTIKELRQIGMSIEEIKVYLQQRNVKKSLGIIKEQHTELISKIEELVDLEESIRNKIDHLEQLLSEEPKSEIEVKQLKERKLITLNRKIHNNFELCYEVVEVENLLTEKAPILASNRLGVLINTIERNAPGSDDSVTVFVVAKENSHVQKEYLKVIPSGLFACIQYYGELWDRQESIEKLHKYILQNGYTISGEALQIAQIDITITDDPEEIMFEIQVPIDKA